MRHVTCNLVYFVIFYYFNTISADNATYNLTDVLSIEDIRNTLVSLLGVSIDETEDVKINNLKAKLDIIDSYAVNADKYANLLVNLTTESNLNETNFYKALNEDEQFKFLSQKEPKNLYLQIKERMNRDDIFNILAEKESNSEIGRSARKAMGQDYFSKLDDDDALDVIVDKMLGETPMDNHKYDAKENQSIYWDPQVALEELQEHHRHDGRRIFRGERTNIRYYPFMVTVHVMGRFWCGGVLYWHDLVLTSAACLQLMHNNRFFRENPRVLQIRIGSNHSRLSGELVDALEVYFHPGYNPRTLRNNIAVIRLRRHLYFTHHRIPKVITISHSPNSVSPASEVLVLGWGVTKISQTMSYEPVYMQRKFLPVYPNTFCKEVYGKSFISETMFCAGTFTTGEGACDHDAGGPAVVGGSLVGIISFGPAVCGYPNTPTVFTLVGAFADWIETINETMPSYYRGRSPTTTSTRKPLLVYLNTMKSLDSLPTEADIDPLLQTTQQTVDVTDDTITPTEVDVTNPPALRMMAAGSSDDSSWGDT